MSALLEISGLTIDLSLSDRHLHAVRDVSFEVERGKTLCIVGESGCGKSLTSLSLLNLLPRSAHRTARCMNFAGQDLLTLSERAWSDLRGDRIAMIFQDPMTCLNPAFTLGDQLTEAYQRHRPGRMGIARDRAVHLLEKTGITAAGRRLGQYPHQLSGGLRQRVMIAMALMCEPELLVADEPTTALDVTIQAQILHLLADLRRELGMALILITHDLGIVARIADDVAVMYAGQIVEQGPAADIFAQPGHPYTRGLLECIPIPGKVAPGSRLGTIPGIVPGLDEPIPGCAFASRCPMAEERCRTTPPPWKVKGPTARLCHAAEGETADA
jgi:peptide/nickel transport system ATP-binding protein